jgi:histidine ammonia-lyase
MIAAGAAGVGSPCSTFTIASRMALAAAAMVSGLSGVIRKAPRNAAI